MPNIFLNDGMSRASVGDGVASYVDDRLMAISYKEACKVAVSLANVTDFTNAFTGTNVADGVVVALYDRILLVSQTTTSENGIYFVSAYLWNGVEYHITLARAPDVLTTSIIVPITSGTDADSCYLLSTDPPIVVGTTGLLFSKIFGLNNRRLTIAEGSTSYLQMESAPNRAEHVIGGVLAQKYTAGSSTYYSPDGSKYLVVSTSNTDGSTTYSIQGVGCMKLGASGSSYFGTNNYFKMLESGEDFTMNMTNSGNLILQTAGVAAATFNSSGCTFSAPIIQSSAPSSGSHLTNKTYVDAKANLLAGDSSLTIADTGSNGKLTFISDATTSLIVDKTSMIYSSTSTGASYFVLDGSSLSNKFFRVSNDNLGSQHILEMGVDTSNNIYIRNISPYTNAPIFIDSQLASLNLVTSAAVNVVSRLSFADTGVDSYFNNASGKLYLRNAGTTKMTIASTGIRIGDSTTPTNLLEMYSGSSHCVLSLDRAAGAYSGIIQFNSAGSLKGQFVQDNNGHMNFWNYVNGGNVNFGALSASGAINFSKYDFSTNLFSITDTTVTANTGTMNCTGATSSSLTIKGTGAYSKSLYFNDGATQYGVVYTDTNNDLHVNTLTGNKAIYMKSQGTGVVQVGVGYTNAALAITSTTTTIRGGSGSTDGIVMDTAGNTVHYGISQFAADLQPSGGTINVGTNGNPFQSAYFTGTITGGHIAAAVHNTYSIGATGARFKKIWAVDITSTNAAIADSDVNLKTNIRNVENALETVKKMRPVQYQWKVDSHGRYHTGFIAQELEEAFGDPSIAVVCKDQESGVYGVRYGELVALNTAAIKELSARVDARLPAPTSGEMMSTRECCSMQQCLAHDGKQHDCPSVPQRAPTSGTMSASEYDGYSTASVERIDLLEATISSLSKRLSAMEKLVKRLTMQ